MENLDVYRGKFSESSQRILENAFNEMRQRNQSFIVPEHVFYALMKEETELFNLAMSSLSIDPDSIRSAVENRLENDLRQTGQHFRIAFETTELFKFSMDRARSQGRHVIEASDILYALTTDDIMKNNKLSLLNDILKNPGNSGSIVNADEINSKEKKAGFFSEMQNGASKFLNEFSLNDLVKKNKFYSTVTCVRNNSPMVSSVGMDYTTYNKHESLLCPVKFEGTSKFDELELISTLKKDIENSLSQSRLKITSTVSQNLSNFRFEYKQKKMNGQVQISYKLKKEHYELKAAIIEKRKL